jgi:hypothetical protein
MRNGLIGLVLAFLCAGLAPARRPKGGERLQPAEARPASWERAVSATLAPQSLALSGSLWSDAIGAVCRVPARYGVMDAAARFGELMRMSLHGAERPHAVHALQDRVRAAAWAGQGRVRLAAANDADIASRYVTVAPGATPVVRLIKTSAIRPRRAMLGQEISQAA